MPDACKPKILLQKHSKKLHVFSEGHSQDASHIHRSRFFQAFFRHFFQTSVSVVEVFDVHVSFQELSYHQISSRTIKKKIPVSYSRYSMKLFRPSAVCLKNDPCIKSLVIKRTESVVKSCCGAGARSRWSLTVFVVTFSVVNASRCSRRLQSDHTLVLLALPSRS